MHMNHSINNYVQNLLEIVFSTPCPKLLTVFLRYFLTKMQSFGQDSRANFWGGRFRHRLKKYLNRNLVTRIFAREFWTKLCNFVRKHRKIALKSFGQDVEKTLSTKFIRSFEWNLTPQKIEDDNLIASFFSCPKSIQTISTLQIINPFRRLWNLHPLDCWRWADSSSCLLTGVAFVQKEISSLTSGIHDFERVAQRVKTWENIYRPHVYTINHTTTMPSNQTSHADQNGNSSVSQVASKTKKSNNDWNCQYCKGQFCSRQARDYHEATAQCFGRLYTCRRCLKPFDRPWRLERHQRQLRRCQNRDKILISRNKLHFLCCSRNEI